MESSPQTVIDVDVWKAYIRLSQRLQNVDPKRYENVPEALQQLTPDEINHLGDDDIQALQAADALPPMDPYQVTQQNIQAARAYLRLIQKLKSPPPEYAKFPPILRSISENADEIENLDSDYLQALRYLNVLPETIVPHVKTKPEPPNEPEESRAKHHSSHSSHEQYPDPIAAIEKIGELYNDAATNMIHSIEKDNDAFGSVFKKAGGHSP